MIISEKSSEIGIGADIAQEYYDGCKITKHKMIVQKKS